MADLTLATEELVSGQFPDMAAYHTFPLQFLQVFPGKLISD